MNERVKNSLFLIGLIILCTFIGGSQMLRIDTSAFQAGIHFYFGRVNALFTFISMIGISFIVKDAIIEAMFDDEDDFEDEDEDYEVNEYTDND